MLAWNKEKFKGQSKKNRKLEGFIIEVKINKEIQRYQESILFGLSLRQMVFALLAIGVAVGAYFGLKPLIGATEVGWVCMLAAFPFAMCGFLLTTACPPSDSCWRSSARKSSARERLHIIHRICTRSFYWTTVQCGRC